MEFDVTDLRPVSMADPKSALQTAYQKHATELTSIEDRLNKLLLVIIGIFGAGATAISRQPSIAPGPARVLIVVVLVFTGYGLKYIYEIQHLRSAVRHLLVRCEIAMDFYKKGVFLLDKPLYTDEELTYAEKGGFLSRTYMACISFAAFGLIVLIYLACPHLFC